MAEGRAATPFDAAERVLSRQAPEHLPTLELADRVSDALGKVMQAFDLPHCADEEPPDEWVQTKALLYLGLLAGRSLRSLMLLLEHGYDAEALAFQRRLVEIHARAQRVVDRQAGAQRAREWLRGQDKKPSGVVELPPGAWQLYSHPVHADYRAAEHHLVDRRADGTVQFTLLPHRNIDKANATATIAAAETRDVAATIADFKQLRINGLERLDADVHEALARWVVPADAPSA